MNSAVWGVWRQDLINIASNVFSRFGENIALSTESIHGLTLPQCLRRPVPLPAEEACCGWRSYVRHHQEKKKILYGLENLDQNSPMETKIIPDNNKPGLICPVQLHHELHLEIWWYVRYCRDLFLHDGAVSLKGLWSTQWDISPALPQDVQRNCIVFLLFYSTVYIVLLCIYYTQYWNISMCVITVCHKTTTFVPKGTLATLQYSTGDTVMWYGTVL